MNLTERLTGIGRKVTAVLGLYASACSSDGSQGCTTDYDCREPRVCIEQVCTNPNGGSTGDDDPYYPAMCEDYRDWLDEEPWLNGQGSSDSVEALYAQCIDTCVARNYAAEGSRRLCAEIYCVFTDDGNYEGEELTVAGQRCVEDWK